MPATNGGGALRRSETMRRLGGPIGVDDLGSHAFDQFVDGPRSEAVRRVLDYSRRPNMQRFEGVDVLTYRSAEINAEAGQDEQGAYIALPLGLCLGLTKFWRCAMASRDVLTHVGQPWLEAQQEDHARHSRQSSDVPQSGGIQAWIQQHSGPIPRCPKRQAFAEIMQWITVQFVIDHEYAHHSHGHVAWAKSQNIGASFHERAASQGIMAPGVQRALEMDADAFAVCQLVSMFMKWTKQEESDTSDLDVIMTPTLDKAMRHVLLAIVAFSWITGSVGDRLELWDSQTHPHPLVRMASASATAWEYLRTHGFDQEAGALRLAVSELRPDLEGLFGPDLGDVAACGLGYPGAHQEIVARLDSMRRDWTTIRPTLVPLAWVTNLAE
jgi:hypothetical protein